MPPPCRPAPGQVRPPVFGSKEEGGFTISWGKGSGVMPSWTTVTMTPLQRAHLPHM
jgi:hypothetical protein